MAWVRCPMCTHSFRAQPGNDQVCPACGHRARVANFNEPDAPPPEELPVDVLGKPRRTFGYVGFTLAGLVFAWIYPVIWHFKVFRELDKQHNRYHLVQYWILGLVPLLNLVFVPAYMIGEMRKLRIFRRAHGLRAGISPVIPVVILFVGVAAVNGAVALAIFHGADQDIPKVSEIVEEWGPLLDGRKRGENPDWPAYNETDGREWFIEHPTLTAGIVLVIPTMVAAALLSILSTAFVNPSIKGLWRAIYDEKGLEWPFQGAAEEPVADPGWPGEGNDETWQQ